MPDSRGCLRKWRRYLGGGTARELETEGEPGYAGRAGFLSSEDTSIGSFSRGASISGGASYLAELAI